MVDAASGTLSRSKTVLVTGGAGFIEAARRTIAAGGELRRFVLASTSSIYGDAEELPTAETARPLPVSPYGITKLAAERLKDDRLGSQKTLSGPTTTGLTKCAIFLFTGSGPRSWWKRN